MKRTARGQSLGEYGVAAALVAIVGIGACTFVVTELGKMLPGLSERVFNGGGGSLQVAISAPSPHNPVLPSGRSITTSGETVTFTMANGQTLKFPKQTTATQLVETAGGNGSTEFYLAQLEQLIVQLEAEGAPAEQMNPLKALLKSGDRIAGIQGFLEKNWVDFQLKNDEEYWYDGVYTDTFDFKGQALTQMEIASHLEFRCFGCSSYSDPDDKVKTPEAETFQKLFQQVQASGLPASTLDQVHTLVTNIAQVAAASGNQSFQQSGNRLPKGVDGNIKLINGEPFEYVSFDTTRPSEVQALQSLWMAQNIATHGHLSGGLGCVVCKPYDSSQIALASQ